MPAAVHNAGLPLSYRCRCRGARFTAYPVVISRACRPLQIRLPLCTLFIKDKMGSMMTGKMPWHVTQGKSAKEVVTAVVLC